MMEWMGEERRRWRRQGCIAKTRKYYCDEFVFLVFSFFFISFYFAPPVWRIYAKRAVLSIFLTPVGCVCIEYRLDEIAKSEQRTNAKHSDFLDSSPIHLLRDAILSFVFMATSTTTGSTKATTK